jgi:FkbM family methyltransferase
LWFEEQPNAKQRYSVPADFRCQVFSISARNISIDIKGRLYLRLGTIVRAANLLVANPSQFVRKIADRLVPLPARPIGRTLASGYMSASAVNIKQAVRSAVPTRVWNWLRVLRIRYTILASRRRRERHNYGGFSLNVEIGDPIGRGWYDHDWPELPEVAVLRRYGLRPGATVFDVGAHQCIVAMMLSKVVEPGLVVAVEGNRYNASVGRRNVESNGIGNLRVIHGAGGAKSGTVTFTENWNGQVNSGAPDAGSVQVRCYTIDELSRLFGRPQVLFIDVEGYEGEVLVGASDTLSSFPDCFVEVHVGAPLETFGATAETILAFFPAEHYRLFVRIAEDEQFRELQAGEITPKVRFFLLAIARVF